MLFYPREGAADEGAAGSTGQFRQFCSVHNLPPPVDAIDARLDEHLGRFVCCCRPCCQEQLGFPTLLVSAYINCWVAADSVCVQIPSFNYKVLSRGLLFFSALVLFLTTLSSYLLGMISCRTEFYFLKNGLMLIASC